MPNLQNLTLLAPDGSDAAFNGIIPAGAKVGDVIAIIGGMSPRLINGSLPTLKAAYAVGRSVLTFLTDSTGHGWGSGTGGPFMQNGDNLTNPAAYVRQQLNAAGIRAVDGCVVFGDRISVSGAVQTPSQAALCYSPNAFTADSGWSYHQDYGSNNFNDLSPWGPMIGVQGPGSLLTWSPGFAFDHAEVWYGNPATGIRPILSVGGAQVDIFTEGSTPYNLNKRSASFARQNPALTISEANAGDVLGVGGMRVWDSTVGSQVQVETLANAGWKTSDWATTGRNYSPLTAIPSLGSHAFIINLGLNDFNTGRSVASFKADLKTLAQKCISTGADVLLAIPNICTASGWVWDSSWPNAIIAAANELGLSAPIDLRTSGLVEADYYDGVHLRASGYAKNGAVIASRVMA